MRKGRRRDDVTVIGETDTKITVRWNRPIRRVGETFTFIGNKKIVMMKDGKPQKGWRIKKGRLVRA